VHGGTHGRRWADHQYPGRDTPYAEDMGRSQRVWSFTGYLIGDDYPLRRLALVAACELAGPGPLIHPTVGVVMAVCRTFTHSEARDRGRYVTLTFEFAEAGGIKEPSSLLDLSSLVGKAAEKLSSVLGDSFLSSFTTIAGGAFLAGAVVGQIVSLATSLQRLRLPAPGVDQGPIHRSLLTLATTAPALARDPPALAKATDTVFADFTDAGDALPVASSMLLVAAPQVMQAAFPLLIGDELPSLPAPPQSDAEPVPVIEQRRINAVAYDIFARGLALREVGYSAPGVAFDNYDEAMRYLDTVARSFIAVEEVVAAAGEDATYEALAGLRADITTLIRARAANLTPLVHYRVTNSTAANALTFAWRLYQDCGRDIEVIDKTHTRTPGFMPFTGRVLAQ
jgi:hypothetical protein